MSYRLYRASEVGYMLHINLSIFLKTFDMSDNWKCHRLNNRRRGNDETAIIENVCGGANSGHLLHVALVTYLSQI